MDNSPPIANAPSPRPPALSGRLVLLAWALLRLPLGAIALYLCKEPLIDLAESLGLFEGLVNRTIFLGSTLAERLLSLGVMSVVLLGIAALSRRCQSWRRQRWCQYAATFAILCVLFQVVPTRRGPLLAAGLTGLLVVNSQSTPQLWAGIRQHQRLANWGFGLAVGLAEILLLKPFILWLLTLVPYRQKLDRGGRSPLPQRHQTRGRLALLDQLPPIMIAALAAFLLNSQPLLDLAARWHGVGSAATPQRPVQKFAAGDFNGLALNPEQHQLYVSGHGLAALHAYDTNDLAKPPQKSPVPSSYAQGFAYSATHGELYVYNAETDTLQILNANGLTLRRSLPHINVAPGDAWVVWDAVSDRIIIASEADHPGGHALVVIHRPTGQVVQQLDLNTGNIFLHPGQPVLYLSAFRRTNQLMRYDTQTGAIAQVPTDPRVHRMGWDNQRDELLLASSVRSKVLRYDAQTLEFKGTIPTAFSVRSVAVDPQRHLLLTAGLANNMLEVIDLNTYKKIAAYYLGPWLREICLDAEAGIAYVSANGALFKVQYVP